MLKKISKSFHLGFFFLVYKLYVDKEYSLDFIGLIKERYMEAAVEVETLIEAHNNEKIIQKLLCKENCELDKFLDTATDSAKRLNCPSKKNFFFKSIAVSTMLSLLIYLFFLRSLAKKIKNES